MRPKKSKIKFKLKKNVLAATLAVVVGVGTYAYIQYKVDAEIDIITVPYAAKELPGRSEITENDIIYMPVPSSAIPPNAIRDVEMIIGKYVVEGFGITPNSFFFEDKILNRNELPDAAILNLREGEYAFPLIVNIESSSGNSIIPNTYVDLYFLANEQVEENGQLVTKPFVSKLGTRIRVTSAKDSNTSDVFEENSQDKKDRSTSGIEAAANSGKSITKLYTFAINEDQVKLFNQAKLLGDIIPVAAADSHLEGIKGKAYGISATKEWIQKHSID